MAFVVASNRKWITLLLLLCVAVPRVEAALLTLTGNPSDTGFGVSVSIPGDLNGDGSPDVVVGATTFEFQGDAVPGRVYVYFGGPAVDAVADLVLTGQANGDRFGYVHSGAGDMNGDGYQDLLVGAYLNDGNGISSGRAYVYYGGPGLDATADLVLTGLQTGEQLGIAVAGVGDVNADGHDDVLIGARFNTTGGSEAGRGYVYFGGPGVDSVPDLILESQTPTERLGFAVAGGADVNHDGHADFAVGAYHNPVQGFETGRVYVYFGGPTADAVADLVLPGEGFRAHFGDALGMSDVNGDGEGDILVGASQFDGARGRASVYFGGAAIDNVADLVVQAGNLGDWFGRFVSGGADLDSDGYADLLVGAPALNSGGPGRAYVYHGGPTVDGTFDATLDGERLGDAHGWHGSAAAQDVNADGIDDLIVGAFRNDTAGNDVGRAYLHLSENKPPDCSQAAPSIAALWPPNHDLVMVEIAGVTDPDGDATSLHITGIASDEAPRGRRGDPCPDAFNDGTSARLRAERNDGINGRVYTVSFEAEDVYGATCAGTVQVCVPLQFAGTCTDDGASVDATTCPLRVAVGLVVRPNGPGVDIDFDLDRTALVELEVLDVRGRRLRHATYGQYVPGTHTLAWDGLTDRAEPAPAGIYILRLRTGTSTQSTKVALLR